MERDFMIQLEQLLQMNLIVRLFSQTSWNFKKMVQADLNNLATTSEEAKDLNGR